MHALWAIMLRVTVRDRDRYIYVKDRLRIQSIVDTKPSGEHARWTRNHHGSMQGGNKTIRTGSEFKTDFDNKSSARIGANTM